MQTLLANFFPNTCAPQARHLLCVCVCAERQARISRRLPPRHQHLYSLLVLWTLRGLTGGSREAITQQEVSQEGEVDADGVTS